MMKKALVCGLLLAACSGEGDAAPAAGSRSENTVPEGSRTLAAAGQSGIEMSAAIGGAGSSAAIGVEAPAVETTGNICADTGELTRAMRLEFDVSWPTTLGLDAGSGKVVVFAKLRYHESAGQWLTEHKLCGTDLPVVTTSLLVNNLKSSNHIPSSAFDSPNMPVADSIVSSAANMLSIGSGPGLLGIALQPADAPWPPSEAVVPADHDGDGKPGLTAIPETGDGFITPPVNVSQDRLADQIYVAARVHFTRYAPQQSCSTLREGSANIDSFNYAIIGCHVQGGDECAVEETRFIARAAPLFDVSPTGRWMQREVSADAKCGDVRAVFSAQ